MIWTAHVTVATVVEYNGRFLMVEELIDGRIMFNQPAGHLENNETLLAAAVRETREETAWQVEPEALVGIYQWQHPGNGETFIRFSYAAVRRQHHPDQPLDKGIQRAVWLTQAEITALQAQWRSPMVMRCIEDYLAGHRYPLNLITAMPSD
ncbi:MAG: NUDIX hydrolase [Candidatus Competibacteraceae bacterium]|jgi:ADP-ribose pyrophosphatase YjhB (NUDIX family)|nr:NUDIX hydrolase [Candidatus Competibacteraceae bacterium]